MIKILEKLFLLEIAFADHTTTHTGTSRELSDILKELVGKSVGLGIAIATLFIIFAAFQIITAGGSEEQFEKGKKTITYAVIGLIVLILSRAIVLTVREFFGAD